MFHYLVQSSSEDSRIEKRHWDDYVAVNRKFADTVINRYQPNDISKLWKQWCAEICTSLTCNTKVFVNDYHLLLVPEMIREKLPDAAIGIFIHATFPSSEIFRCLQSKEKQ